MKDKIYFIIYLFDSLQINTGIHDTRPTLNLFEKSVYFKYQAHLFLLVFHTNKMARSKCGYKQ